VTISGSLKDVSAADVMQFIHLGHRSGVLTLEHGERRAALRFHRGRLISARSPQMQRLGDLLVSSGRVTSEALRAAVEAQLAAGRSRSLGQILVESNAIDGEELRRLISLQISQAVTEVVAWDAGTFDFSADDTEPPDDLGLQPTDLLPEAEIDTQLALLEAARLFDERDRHGAEEGAPTSAPTPAPVFAVPAPAESEPDQDLAALFEEHPERPPQPRRRPTGPVAPRLELVSHDHALALELEVALVPEQISLSRVRLSQAGEHAPHEMPPVVLVDLRGEGPSLEAAHGFHARHPSVPLIALTSGDAPLGAVYGAGALAALPAEDLGSVVTCIRSVLASRRALVQAAAAPVAHDPVKRLQRLFGELRSGLISATVALHLMQVVSEAFERAVLLLVQRNELAVLGAFGSGSGGRPLAEAMRGLRLPIEQQGAFGRALSTGETQRCEFETAFLPSLFAARLGRPRTGQAVVFPVQGAQRAIALVYADNGPRDEPVSGIDLLELAAAQVGIAFENELLRRQVDERRGPG